MEQLRLPLSPDYTVRVSRRVKRAQLHVSEEGKVEVIIPRRFNPAQVPEFVAENQCWLDRTLGRIQAQRTGAKKRLPKRISLSAIGERWQVVYRHGSKSGFQMGRGDGQQLVLEIISATESDCRATLKHWLSCRAKDNLVPWLRRLSVELGLPFRKATVRGQKTCWGSCSPLQTISLNRSLLFLPPKTVRYLMVHELCHTVHGDHSPQYWKLVAEMEPRCKQLDAKLRDAGRYVPSWAVSP